METEVSQFNPEIEEEYEDDEGNILKKKTYNDMRRQGLIREED
jgi:splicing factor 3A subunit 3